ncbi:uncharacterized protein LOC124226353 [Equus quagga]|uniref:uncharacterized protein LOC124226353 n=1 Tax=Equus quagga TaxID=89248 RepID=UPI001EE35E68|nr:uncharacterized protein LOC124226353 [Equus quagga]XP_046495468.1 uncharacterized protein LOC124226353 [Equus quagga]XP_046495469.1 uncharacterized protein LOC124226353 [Equus quagga]XP_046495470.1 uncharacterized protein LOC124226353 [Equus quagga]XP_046495471.1 uncharacterized protein LOC124226353 [Equus quagga]XP_046495472.1 uncharacterized protein LOC124226353 [Equus quagga]XP_046495473.1 uncharacterized protein LOC124226353 [Equus quagga]
MCQGRRRQESLGTLSLRLVPAAPGYSPSRPRGDVEPEPDPRLTLRSGRERQWRAGGCCESGTTVSAASDGSKDVGWVAAQHPVPAARSHRAGRPRPNVSSYRLWSGAEGEGVPQAGVAEPGWPGHLIPWCCREGTGSGRCLCARVDGCPPCRCCGASTRGTAGCILHILRVAGGTPQSFGLSSDTARSSPLLRPRLNFLGIGTCQLERNKNGSISQSWVCGLRGTPVNVPIVLSEETGSEMSGHCPWSHSKSSIKVGFGRRPAVCRPPGVAAGPPCPACVQARSEVDAGRAGGVGGGGQSGC